MANTIDELFERIHKLEADYRVLDDRLDLLENQNLHERLEQAEELANRRAEESDHSFRRAFDAINSIDCR